jgi:Zn-dependent peptidase ImmA (M78 family)
LPGIFESVPVEAAANRFAGAFLVSKEAAFRELGRHRHNINIPELYLLKLKYGFSMQAWLRRALELSIISEDLESCLFRELKSQGAPKVEPGDQVPSEEPGRMKRMAWRAVAEGVVTRSRASELAGIEM